MNSTRRYDSSELTTYSKTQPPCKAEDLVGRGGEGLKDTSQSLEEPICHPRPVVQRTDNFIARIGRYAADKIYWLQYILSA